MKIRKEQVLQKIILPVIGILFLLAILYVSLQAGAAANATQNYIPVSTKKLPIYSVETQEKKVALTFDSAWNIDDLDEILGILEKNKIKAAFFMTGEWVEKYPDAVKKLVEKGHDLGNHGDSHAHMNSLSKEQCKEEIYGAHKKVFELTGIEMDLFRPPYGEYNDTVIQTAEEMGYYPCQWDVDSLDWKDYGVEDMVNRVVNHKNLQNGSIILLHNGTQYTAKALQALIDGLRNQGYEFAALSELILKENYEINIQGRQILLSNESLGGVQRLF